MRYAYPYVAEAQPEGGWTVTFPDVPEAITQGDRSRGGCGHGGGGACDGT